ncbi:MAG: ATP-dependent metallopeptidase FtsH/Yme1/Tma family protein, partial [Vulcanimicrobiaceae bacterium]
MGKHARAILLILCIFVFVIFVVEKVLQPTQTTRISYSQFYTYVQQGKVSKV